MHFWTRMLVIIAVMNIIIVIGAPILGICMSNPLLSWFGFQGATEASAAASSGMCDTGWNSTYDYLKNQPASSETTQNYSISLESGGINVDNPLTGLVAPFKLIWDLVSSVMSFINAPLDLMYGLQFPGIFIVILGIGYYTALIIGIVSTLAGRTS